MNILERTVDAVRKMDKSPVSWARGGVRLLRDSPIEVAIFGVAGLVIGAGISYRHESNREKHIPVGFSEIRQIEKSHKSINESVPPMTHYLTTTNDALMKIFECWNIANERTLFGSPYRAFAQELENTIGQNQKIYGYNLEGLLKVIPERADRALDKIGNFIDTSIQVSQAKENFEEAWDESHHDHYRTETYTDTEHYTDSNGKRRSRTVTKTRRVYDHTTHSYTYHKDAGEEASRRLSFTVVAHPELIFEETLAVVTKTGAENEYAIDKSRPENERRMTPEELLNVANRWNTGSTIKSNLPEIYSSWNALGEDSSSWNNAKNEARSQRYNTQFPFDSGPKEFQIVEEAIENAGTFTSNVNEITSGMVYCRENAPTLLEKVRNYISIELDRKKGNAKREARQIIEESVRIYNLNFKEGFEVERFRGYAPVLFGLLGLVVGGTLGAGLNHLSEKRGWYHTKTVRDFLAGNRTE